MKYRLLSALSMLVAAIAVCNALPRTLGLPVTIKPELAANFAELRPDHFHGGLDFKTQGRTGLPMLAVAPGYISRVSVSPSGYGHAMYVTHPQLGITTVYGHLASFGPEIDEMVLRRQRADRSFSVDLTLAPWSMPVAAGDTIAFSGNTGHSGGPHLHFEVRDLVTDIYYDPLQWYSALIPDTTPPEVLGLALVSTRPDGTLTFSQIAGGEIEAWGEVYPAVRVYDRMDGQANTYGAKHITLMVDGRKAWERHLDVFPSLFTRAINTLVYYPKLVEQSQWWEWTRMPRLDPFHPLMRSSQVGSTGGVIIDSERDYQCEYILTDHYGNITRVPFTIHGVRRHIPLAATHKASYPVHATEPAAYTLGAMQVAFPAYALYDDALLEIVPVDGAGRFKIFPAAGHVPVAEPYTIAIRLDALGATNANKLVVRNRTTGQRLPTRPLWDHGLLVAESTSWGDFEVLTDDTAPTISREGSGLSFIVTDNLSGIFDWYASIDGRYVVMDHDSKNRRLRYIDDPSLRGTFTLTVIDRAGNIAEYQCEK